MSRVNRKLKSRIEGEQVVTKLGFGKDGLRKMRCPSCQTEMTAKKGSKGETVYYCMCGRTFKSQKM